MALTSTIKCKIGSTEEWESTNRRLERGEFGVEVTNTDQENIATTESKFLIKIGDGLHQWKSLPYANDYETLLAGFQSVSDIATEELNGLMSKEDKEKLDTIDRYANNYSHPTNIVTPGTYCRVKVNGAGHVIEGEHEMNIDDATQTKSGLMSLYDKQKLDNIAFGANNYILPVASSNTLGGVKIGTNITIDNEGRISAVQKTYGLVTSTSMGLMSTTDKKRLDDIYQKFIDYDMDNFISNMTSNTKALINSAISDLQIDIENLGDVSTLLERTNEVPELKARIESLEAEVSNLKELMKTKSNGYFTNTSGEHVPYNLAYDTTASGNKAVYVSNSI